jgi:hypothetical protein
MVDVVEVRPPPAGFKNTSLFMFMPVEQLISPTTSNFADGPVVPTPTFPLTFKFDKVPTDVILVCAAEDTAPVKLPLKSPIKIPDMSIFPSELDSIFDTIMSLEFVKLNASFDIITELVILIIMEKNIIIKSKYIIHNLLLLNQQEILEHHHLLVQRI